MLRNFWDRVLPPPPSDMSGGSQDEAESDSDFTDDTDSGEEAVLDSSSEGSPVLCTLPLRKK